MNKSQFSKYNDGVIRIYREKQRETDFNAKLNVTTLNDMEFVARLDYGEASMREQDREFAQQNGFSLTMKVKTRRLKTVDNKCKAVIDNYLYDVSYVDKSGVEMWLYLEGIRSLA